VNIVGNFGTVFCDQAYWQSSVAAKPLQGVWGFIAGGLTWFAIPFTLATTMGLAYVGMSSAQNGTLLSDDDVSKGLVAPVVAQNLLGSVGEYSMLFLILMAVMSTGSAEIIAVASIIIYDIYQAYIQPFRKDLKSGHCILCAKPMRVEYSIAKSKDTEYENEPPNQSLCVCPSAMNCAECKRDISIREKTEGLVKPPRECIVHGAYKTYQECLLNYKNWCIVICTLLSIPLCLFCYAVDLDLEWTYYFTGILIASSVVPISLSILWARATSSGMVAGVVGGCLSGIIVWLSYASTYDGGLSAENFVTNTGEDYPMLAGNVTSLVVGAMLVVIVSLFTRRSMTKKDVEEEWEKTREIDNPL
jgi:Na+/proline symporter